ncbi:hypothetical protein [Natrinema sp. DC36]|uniref:phage NrS-1 polymerase family protein n=1 Tax=Natrinema sp. DC36 TaxID=2878680 RepID=UPI001CEFDC6F|nr:hypothetical protein [Natrinema sp. DC36]
MSSENGPQRQHGWGLVPKELRGRDQWVVTTNKVPVIPAKGWQKYENQMAFQKACRLSNRQNGEPAYVLLPDDPFVIIDFDDIGPPKPTKVSDEVAEIVKRLNTYVEASRSQTGLHLVCKGTRLPDRNEKAELKDRGTIEVYDSGQYVVLTGNQLDPYDSVRCFNQGSTNECNPLIDLQRTYLPEQTESVNTNKEYSDYELSSASDRSLNLTSKDIRRTLEEYTKDGSSKAERALSRWNSPAESAYRFPTASEADLAFVSDLAFWCQEDAQLMEDCFRSSQRMRSKWDIVHYSDGRTYGEGTIQTAIRSNYDIFSGHHVTISD